MTVIARTLFCLLVFLGSMPALGAVGGDVADGAVEPVVTSKDARFLLGVGYGSVRFDVNAKVTDRDGGLPRYVDLEGNLGLDEYSRVRSFYGSYLFNDRHSLVFSYFDVNRSSTLAQFSGSFGDLRIEDGSIRVFDDSRFYNIGYGYRLFDSDSNRITLVAGLNVLDLSFTAEARGEIVNAGVSRSEAEVTEADSVAPLPLVGLNFTTRYTAEWSLATRVSLIAGSYQDVSAQIFETSIISRYQFSKHVGLLLGLAFFSAEVDEKDSDELTEISYAYDGLYLGLHFGL